MPAKAQDVVRYGDSCYLFNPFNPIICGHVPPRGWDWDADESPFCLDPGYRCGYEYILPGKTTVYGIAATVLRHKDDSDSAGYTVYLYTVENGTDLVCLDSATVYSKETQFIYSAICNDSIIEAEAPCYEYFFSQPHAIEGAIYIGAAFDIGYHYGSDINWINFIYHVDVEDSDQHWINFDTGMPLQMIWGMSWYWGGYFPIIQPERVDCTAPVAEVNVTGDGDAVLTWEMASDSCQLSITQSNMPVDSGLVVVLTNNGYTATGLAGGGTLYAARLRTQCHHHCPAHADSLVWSDWGRATYFRIGNQGVLDAEPVEWSLTPNPAHGNATVQCEVGMTSVEVLTVKGERIMLRDMEGQQTCTLDLSGLAKGIYIVQVTTTQGTAARKLAVE